MFTRNALSIAASAAVAAATTGLALWSPGHHPAVGKTTQTLSARGTPAIITPAFKTFSTTSGRGTKIVISTGGNITSYLSPNTAGAQYEHIGVGALSEGYVLCYTGLSGSAFDTGDNSSGFNAPTTSGSTVTRSTTDGKVSFGQTFTFTAGTPTTPTQLLVSMTAKNTSGSALHNVIVRRQVDFDIDTGGAQGWAGFQSSHARTKAAVMAFHDPSEAPAGLESHGIMMANVTTAGTFQTMVTQNILDSSCSPAQAPLDSTTFVARGDFGDSISYNLGTINPGASKTVAVRYLRY